jgi:hypothetical protein
MSGGLPACPNPGDRVAEVHDGQEDRKAGIPAGVKGSVRAFALNAGLIGDFGRAIFWRSRTRYKRRFEAAGFSVRRAEHVGGAEAGCQAREGTS